MVASASVAGAATATAVAAHPPHVRRPRNPSHTLTLRLHPRTAPEYLCAQLHEVFIDRFSELDEILKRRLMEVIEEWAPGIDIITVRMVKPTIPETIQEKFSRANDLTSKLKTVNERQHVELAAVEKERSLSVMAAEKDAAVAQMVAEARVLKAKEKVALENVSNTMHVARSKERADAYAYGRMKEAEVNRRRLTPEFLAMRAQQEYLKGMDMYLGSHVPTTFAMRSNGDNDGEGGGGGVENPVLLTQGMRQVRPGLEKEGSAEEPP